MNEALTLARTALDLEHGAAELKTAAKFPNLGRAQNAIVSMCLGFHSRFHASGPGISDLWS